MGLILDCMVIFDTIRLFLEALPFAIRLCIYASSGITLLIALLKVASNLGG